MASTQEESGWKFPKAESAAIHSIYLQWVTFTAHPSRHFSLSHIIQPFVRPPEHQEHQGIYCCTTTAAVHFFTLYVTATAAVHYTADFVDLFQSAEIASDADAPINPCLGGVCAEHDLPVCRVVAQEPLSSWGVLIVANSSKVTAAAATRHRTTPPAARRQGQHPHPSASLQPGT